MNWCVLLGAFSGRAAVVPCIIIVALISSIAWTATDSHPTPLFCASALFSSTATNPHHAQHTVVVSRTRTCSHTLGASTRPVSFDAGAHSVQARRRRRRQAFRRWGPRCVVSWFEPKRQPRLGRPLVVLALTCLSLVRCPHRLSTPAPPSPRPDAR